ncbi:MAG: aerial mycelium formation protein [Actinomycetota bacterium]|nr:aerial mycelium formation protein [Actinomycetota bacterium]
MASASLDALLQPEYLRGLPSLPIDEIRSRRDQATEVEVGLSYVRRLIQGRMDIVLAEVRGREEGGARGDIGELVRRLPEILGDRVRGPGMGRLPTLMAPAEPELSELHRLDDIVDAEALGNLPERSDSQLGQIVDALASFEHEVSAGRRAVHDVIDQLQDELVRRYKSGEANVDTLLS